MCRTNTDGSRLTGKHNTDMIMLLFQKVTFKIEYVVCPQTAQGINGYELVDTVNSNRWFSNR